MNTVTFTISLKALVYPADLFISPSLYLYNINDPV